VQANRHDAYHNAKQVYNSADASRWAPIDHDEHQDREDEWYRTVQRLQATGLALLVAIDSWASFARRVRVVHRVGRIDRRVHYVTVYDHEDWSDGLNFFVKNWGDSIDRIEQQR
jgi:hypothetical protein